MLEEIFSRPTILHKIETNSEIRVKQDLLTKFVQLSSAATNVFFSGKETEH